MDESITIYVDEADKKLLKEFAKENRLALGSYLRNMILSQLKIIKQEMPV